MSFERPRDPATDPERRKAKQLSLAKKFCLDHDVWFRDICPKCNVKQNATTQT